MSEIKLRKTFLLFMGMFLVSEGIWGLFSTQVYGVLTTNYLYSFITISLGALCFYYCQTKSARRFSSILGIILLVIGILRFVFIFDGLEKWLLNINENMALLNIISGIALLFFGMPRYMALYYNRA